MAILLEIGFSHLLLNSVKDAQTMIGILNRATNVSYISDEKYPGVREKFNTKWLEDGKISAQLHMDEPEPLTMAKVMAHQAAVETEQANNKEVVVNKTTSLENIRQIKETIEGKSA